MTSSSAFVATNAPPSMVFTERAGRSMRLLYRFGKNLEDGVSMGTPRADHARVLSGSQDPEDAIENTTVVYPRSVARLVRQHRPDGDPFIIGEFVAHDSS